MDDDLFTLDIVREFIVLKGGKVTNHQLVTHFKTFLNDTSRRKANREKFKDFVNTLATVKLDENGEKVLVLKRKYRDVPVESTPNTSSRHLPKRPAPKATYKDPTFLNVTNTQDATSNKSDLGLSSHSTGSDNVFSPDPAHEPRPVLRLTDAVSQESDTDAVGISSDATITASAVPVAPPRTSRSASVTDTQTPLAPTSRAESEQSLPDQFAAVTISSGSTNYPSSEVLHNNLHNDLQDNPQDDPHDINEPEPPYHQINTDNHMYNHTDDLTDNHDNQITETTDMTPNETSMSVKDQIKQLNRMQSTTDVLNTTAQPNSTEDNNKINNNNNKEEDVNSIAFHLEAYEREWLVTMARANYQDVSKLLSKNQQLIKKKDVTMGYSALHWASKHGNADVVKLLCGTPGVQINGRSYGGYTPLHIAAMQGHEEIIELLVTTYNADTNIRDYSGKKAKQYLRNSASTRSQRRSVTDNTSGLTELLLSRRDQNSGGSMPFKRSGSYSAKIQKSGFFGINAPAVRSSWSSGSLSAIPGVERGHHGSDRGQRVSERGVHGMDRISRSQTPSPHQSPRNVPRKGSLPVVTYEDRSLMPPPDVIPTRSKQRNRRAESYSDSEDCAVTSRRHDSDGESCVEVSSLV